MTANDDAVIYHEIAISMLVILIPFWGNAHAIGTVLCDTDPESVSARLSALTENAMMIPVVSDRVTACGNGRRFDHET